MTPQQIDEEIAKETIAFNNKVYDGPALPEDILEKFSAGIMRGGTDRPELIKSIISKEVDELTWMEVGMVINYVKSLPFEINFDSLPEALEYLIALGKITTAYNEVCNKVDEDLMKKRELKYKLAGIGNGISAPIPMRKK